MNILPGNPDVVPARYVIRLPNLGGLAARATGTTGLEVRRRQRGIHIRRFYIPLIPPVQLDGFLAFPLRFTFIDSHKSRPTVGADRLVAELIVENKVPVNACLDIRNPLGCWDAL